MRTKTHIIDTRAIKKTIAALPDHWVIRELTERDYGIDLMVEIFVPGLKDAKDRDAYASSGALLHLQVKGTEDAVKEKSGVIKYQLKRNSLLYVEKFSTPFLLVHVDLSEDGKIYFVWLQRYIKDVLDVSGFRWREVEKKSVRISIPEINSFTVKDRDSALRKISKIAFWPKYTEELVEYCELFRDFDNRIVAISHGTHEFNDSVMTSLKNNVSRIGRLDVLLTQNDYCVTRVCIGGLLEHLEKMNTNNLSSAGSYPNKHNLSLLAYSLDNKSLSESFVAGNEGNTVY